MSRNPVAALPRNRRGEGDVARILTHRLHSTRPLRTTANFAVCAAAFRVAWCCGTRSCSSTAGSPTSANDPRHRVAANRPAALREGCNTRGERPTFIAETQRRDPSTRCERLYPSASFPREVAGAGVGADVVGCRLKPVDTSDYRVAFTAAQRARLRAIFPSGVCDWSRPGVGEQAPDGTWLSFGPRARP